MSSLLTLYVMRPHLLKQLLLTSSYYYVASILCQIACKFSIKTRVRIFPKRLNVCCNNMEENASAEEPKWLLAKVEERKGQKEWTFEESVNPNDKLDSTLLDCAVFDGNSPLVTFQGKFILEFEEGDKNPPAADGVTPLRLEIISGNYRICKEILQHVSPARSQARGIHLARPWVNALLIAIKKAGYSGVVRFEFERASPTNTKGHHKGSKVPINPKPKWQKKAPKVVQKVTEVRFPLKEVKKEESNETAKKPSQEVKPPSKGEEIGSQTSEKTHLSSGFLEEACQLFKAQKNYAASVSFSIAASQTEDNSDIWTFLRFCQAFCLQNTQLVDNLNQAETILESLKPCPVQTLGLMVAKFYKRDYNSMKMISLEDLDLIEKPSSNDPLIQTSEIVVEALKRRLEVIRDFFTNVPQPDAYCRHVDCLKRKLDHGFQPRREIYTNPAFKDVDFRGVTSVTCDFKCEYSLHKVCWRACLEDLGTKTDRSTLGQPCPTPDCEGLIDSLSITREDGTCLPTFTNPKLIESLRAEMKEAEEMTAGSETGTRPKRPTRRVKLYVDQPKETEEVPTKAPPIPGPEYVQEKIKPVKLCDFDMKSVLPSLPRKWKWLKANRDALVRSNLHHDLKGEELNGRLIQVAKHHDVKKMKTEEISNLLLMDWISGPSQPDTKEKKATTRDACTLEEIANIIQLRIKDE